MAKGEKIRFFAANRQEKRANNRLAVPYSGQDLPKSGTAAVAVRRGGRDGGGTKSMNASGAFSDVQVAQQRGQCP